MTHPDVTEGMFVASELGVSFHCACGWVSERQETKKDADNIAISHVVTEQYPPTRRPRD